MPCTISRIRPAEEGIVPYSKIEKGSFLCNSWQTQVENSKRHSQSMHRPVWFLFFFMNPVHKRLFEVVKFIAPGFRPLALAELLRPKVRRA